MVNVRVSPTLLEFLEAWYSWAKGLDPIKDEFSEYLFRREFGLCNCLMGWVFPNQEVRVNCVQELTRALLNSELDMIYPFGKENYNQKRRDKCMHKDENRLAWVEQILKNSGSELV